MSGAIVVSSAGASAGAAAAAAHAAKMRDEEENMTKYNSDDLENWEFKIIRSNFARFKDYKVVQQVCAEEAKAGWEMLEKFDDYRIRFKRPINKRAYDQHLTTDPYRTSMGGDGKIGLIIAGSIILLIGLVVFLVVTFNS